MDTKDYIILAGGAVAAMFLLPKLLNMLKGSGGTGSTNGFLSGSDIADVLNEGGTVTTKKDAGLPWWTFISPFTMLTGYALDASGAGDTTQTAGSGKEKTDAGWSWWPFISPFNMQTGYASDASKAKWPIITKYGKITEEGNFDPTVRKGRVIKSQVKAGNYGKLPGIPFKQKLTTPRFKPSRGGGSLTRAVTDVKQKMGTNKAAQVVAYFGSVR